MSTRSSTSQSVQCFGKKKTATAVAHCKEGKGLVKVNGKPLALVEPQILRFKVYEPLLILGLDKFGTQTQPDSRRAREMERVMRRSASLVDMELWANVYFFAEGVDIRVRVSGGGHTSQVYAIRQAIAKSIVRSIILLQRLSDGSA